jgi:hypothetical protein
LLFEVSEASFSKRSDSNLLISDSSSDKLDSTLFRPSGCITLGKSCITFESTSEGAASSLKVTRSARLLSC